MKKYILGILTLFLFLNSLVFAGDIPPSLEAEVTRVDSLFEEYYQVYLYENSDEQKQAAAAVFGYDARSGLLNLGIKGFNNVVNLQFKKYLHEPKKRQAIEAIFLELSKNPFFYSELIEQETRWSKDFGVGTGVGTVGAMVPWKKVAKLGQRVVHGTSGSVASVVAGSAVAPEAASALPKLLTYNPKQPLTEVVRSPIAWGGKGRAIVQQEVSLFQKLKGVKGSGIYISERAGVAGRVARFGKRLVLPVVIGLVAGSLYAEARSLMSDGDKIDPSKELYKVQENLIQVLSEFTAVQIEAIQEVETKLKDEKQLDNDSAQFSQAMNVLTEIYTELKNVKEELDTLPLYMLSQKQKYQPRTQRDVALGLVWKILTEKMGLNIHPQFLNYDSKGKANDFEAESMERILDAVFIQKKQPKDVGEWIEDVLKKHPG